MKITKLYAGDVVDATHTALYYTEGDVDFSHLKLIVKINEPLDSDLNWSVFITRGSKTGSEFYYSDCEVFFCPTWIYSDSTKGGDYIEDY